MVMHFYVVSIMITYFECKPRNLVGKNGSTPIFCPIAGGTFLRVKFLKQKLSVSLYCDLKVLSAELAGFEYQRRRRYAVL